MVRQKNYMQVTLVRPTTFLNTKIHPLNIGYIYAALSSEDYLKVSFVDGEKIGQKYIRDKENINKTPDHNMWKKIAQEILATKPDLVAFSCYSLSMTGTNYITTILRETGFNGQIWVGGNHPTTCCTETLESVAGLNGAVIGEGELTIKELCKAIYDEVPLTKVEGIAYKENGKIEVNKPRPLIENMDELCLPSRTFSGAYTYPEHIILTSRGCPFSCDFCDSKNIWGRRVRYRSAEHVTNEIESIAKLGVKTIVFGDDTFTLNKKRVESICKRVKDRGLNGLNYWVGSRIDTMDEEMLSLLKQLNVNLITFGVETGSSVIQKRIKKNLDLSMVVSTVLKTNKAGIRTITFFMLGHPGETEKDVEATYSLIRELSKYCNKRNLITINIVCPYPGTGYWNYAIEKYGKFIDFCNEGYKYYHQAKPFVNITDMEDQVFASYIARINKFVNVVNIRHKIYSAVRNPDRVWLKIKKELFY